VFSIEGNIGENKKGSKKSTIWHGQLMGRAHPWMAGREPSHLTQYQTWPSRVRLL
jgi:hypothetical protein